MILNLFVYKGREEKAAEGKGGGKQIKLKEVKSEIKNEVKISQVGEYKMHILITIMIC